MPRRLLPVLPRQDRAEQTPATATKRPLYVLLSCERLPPSHDFFHPVGLLLPGNLLQLACLLARGDSRQWRGEWREQPHTAGSLVVPCYDLSMRIVRLLCTS